MQISHGKACLADCRNNGNFNSELRCGEFGNTADFVVGRNEPFDPLDVDEAAVEIVLDLSGRPYLHYEVDFPGEKILSDPPFDPQLVEEFWRAFVMASGITLHIVMHRGRNTHHIVEATFKGVARALRDAVRIESDTLPSTKGTL